MANKFILVPDEIYRGFLSPPSTLPNDDNIGVEFTRQSMAKNLRNKKLNASAKNTLYNQDLSRYLKMRKEAKNRPIKVELSNGAKILNVGSKSYVIETEKAGENTQEAFVPTNDQSETRSAYQAEEPVSPFTPVSHMETSKKHKTKKTKKLRESEVEEPAQRKVDPGKLEKVNRIEKIIMENPHHYGVSRTGALIDPNNKRIPGSNLRDSLMRIIVRDPTTTYSPSGTRTLWKRLNQSPEINSVIYERTPPTPRKTATSIKAGGFNKQAQLWKKD